MTKMSYASNNNIARITLDDGKMNVMNWEFFAELNDCLDQALCDGSRILIFTGRSGVFSAGLDLKLLPTQSLEEQVRFQRTFAETMLRVYLFPLPTIAAYAGHAVAGGAILSYACDRYIAGDGSFIIQINEVANKMMLPTWITLICRSSIPPQFWKEALLHARAYTPREAFEKGIVDDLVAEGSDVLEAAGRTAAELMRLDGRAYATTKSYLRRDEAAHAMDVFDRELMAWLVQTPE